jgi:hypothetical protein
MTHLEPKSILCQIGRTTCQTRSSQEPEEGLRFLQGRHYEKPHKQASEGGYM